MFADFETEDEARYGGDVADGPDEPDSDDTE